MRSPDPMTEKDRWQLFGEYLASRISEAGMTQRAVQDLTGIPQYQVNRDIRSGRALPLERIQLYRDALDLDQARIDDLVGDLLVGTDPVEQKIAVMHTRLKSLLDEELLAEVEKFTRDRLHREAARA